MSTGDVSCEHGFHLQTCTMCDPRFRATGVVHETFTYATHFPEPLAVWLCPGCQRTVSAPLVASYTPNLTCYHGSVVYTMVRVWPPEPPRPCACTEVTPPV